MNLVRFVSTSENNVSIRVPVITDPDLRNMVLDGANVNKTAVKTLEALGDAALYEIVLKIIIKLYPDLEKHPGLCNMLRTQMITNVKFSQWFVRLQMHVLLKNTSKKFFNSATRANFFETYVGALLNDPAHDRSTVEEWIEEMISTFERGTLKPLIDNYVRDVKTVTNGETLSELLAVRKMRSFQTLKAYIEIPKDVKVKQGILPPLQTETKEKELKTFKKLDPCANISFLPNSDEVPEGLLDEILKYEAEGTLSSSVSDVSSNHDMVILEQVQSRTQTQRQDVVDANSFLSTNGAKNATAGQKTVLDVKCEAFSEAKFKKKPVNKSTSKTTDSKSKQLQRLTSRQKLLSNNEWFTTLWINTATQPQKILNDIFSPLLPQIHNLPLERSWSTNIKLNDTTISQSKRNSDLLRSKRNACRRIFLLEKQDLTRALERTGKYSSSDITEINDVLVKVRELNTFKKYIRLYKSPLVDNHKDNVIADDTWLYFLAKEPHTLVKKLFYPLSASMIPKPHKSNIKYTAYVEGVELARSSSPSIFGSQLDTCLSVLYMERKMLDCLLGFKGPFKVDSKYLDSVHELMKKVRGLLEKQSKEKKEKAVEFRSPDVWLKSTKDVPQ
jgi:hypothetical protein